MSEWAKLFGAPDSPYEIPLGVEEGSVFQVPPPYPDAEVQAVREIYPRRIVVQQVDLKAGTPEDGRTENIRVFVVVVETEDGNQIELQRFAAPVDELDAPVIDLTTCEACGGNIPEGQAVVIDGKAYHKRCVQEDSDEVRTIGAARSRAASAGGGRAGGGDDKRVEKEAAPDGNPSEASPKTVSKTREQGKSASHMVTITKLGGDKYLTTLWAKEHDGLSGTADGKWSTGLFPSDVPKDSDVSYIDERFFKGAGVTTKSDLRVWNDLYKRAFLEIEPPF